MLVSGVTHMPLTMKSIEGTFVNKKKSKKGRDEVYKTMHVDLGKQLQEAALIIAEENADVPIGTA